VCEYEVDEKSGGSEAWTVRREEGKMDGLAARDALAIDHCSREDGPGGRFKAWRILY
jgi:hypothetical protein